jgi:chromosome segregation ATPase
LEELEATLDAAFADPRAAESLLGGLLTSGLHYSGLGFSAQTQSGTPPGSRSSSRPARSDSERAVARRSLKTADEEADRADVQLEKARRAVAEADRALTQLKLAERKAAQLSKEAHKKASAARKNFDILR